MKCPMVPIALLAILCFSSDAALAARFNIATVRQQGDALQPTVRHPMRVPKDAKADRARDRKIVAQYMDIPADEVTVHPTAADFPGSVPADAPRVHRSFTFPLKLPRWESTAIYAAPGEKLTVTVSPADAKLGLKVIIGCHTDNISRSTKWTRFPVISRHFKITQPITIVANAFGGLVYIDVPRNPALGGWHIKTYGGYGWLGENRANVPGSFDVKIDGGVAAPLYVLGKTTPAQWAQMQKSVAPFGELASDKVIFSMQTAALARLADPAPVMKFWSRVIDDEAYLAGWPAQPAPPERFVTDRQISAGYMHSGYPVMAHLDAPKHMLDIKFLTTKGDWGPFHEFGHNHEGQAYTFGSDFVEVDVNLFSMYIMQKLVGREMTAHPALKNVDKLLAERIGTDKKGNPWQNLAIFIKTIQAFGWDPLRHTLATYATPHGCDGIKTRDQKTNQWILRYSEATKHNLADYYAAFGLTCTPATREAIKGLPKWMPSP